jgi:16S rRNA (uracil1498-N3)-methyltransferase
MASLRRFFTERENLRPGSSVKILETEAKHIRDSLRMQPGDNIMLVSEAGQFVARLTKVTSDLVMAEVVEEINPDSAGEFGELILFQSLIRLPQMELILQKAVELGVTRVVPVSSEFSQIEIRNVVKRYERWGKIMIEAVKQSERAIIPVLEEPISFAEAIAYAGIDQMLLFTTPRSSIKAISPILSLKEVEVSEGNVGLLIGPEGGFSPLEHKQAAEAKIQFSYFNSHILRAETAAIAAVSIVAHLRT